MLRHVGLIATAIYSGALLALMINVNAEIAKTTSAFQASWVAHGIGCLIALLIYSLFKNRNTEQIKPHITSRKYWFGGIPGALTVVLASLTVQSHIGLTGTLALALIGQFLLSICLEHFGWLGQPKTKASFSNFIPIVFVTIGSLIIIYAEVTI